MSRRPRLSVLLVAAATLTALFAPSASASARTAPAAPRTAVLDGTRLQQTKLRLDRGDPNSGTR